MRKGFALVAIAAATVAAYAGITRAAGSKRAAVSTERVSLTLTARDGSVSVDGTVDNAARRGSFTIDLSNASALAPFRLPVRRVDAVLDTSNGDLHAYVQVPGLLRAFTNGKAWAAVDARALAGGDLGPLTRLATAP